MQQLLKVLVPEFTENNFTPDCEHFRKNFVLLNCISDLKSPRMNL